MIEENALKMLAAMSQELRLHILRFLVGKGEAGAAAGEIGEAIGAAPSKASFHLAALERAGVISAQKQSRKIIYRARFDNLGGLVSFILNDCCARHPDILSCCDLVGKDCC